MAYTLPELNYPLTSLEPYIDARTMEIHHGKHHAAYVNNLNNATKDGPLADLDIVTLCKTMDMTNMVVRNNGGGHYNHCLYWEIMSPHGGVAPTGDLAAAIDTSFGSFDAFKEKFSQAGVTRFGSGWAWLCVTANNALEICSTPNQDNPLMPSTGCGGTPILGMDVWEHAYYLQYQNRRPDYISNFYNVVNWDVVAEKFELAKK